jgi:hypothetical protein
MARGWESKAVADQIEEADGRSRDDELEQIRLTASAEMRARHDRLESLKLSRSRTLEQLERATNPAYREMLQRTLRALESEIDDTK